MVLFLFSKPRIKRERSSRSTFVARGLLFREILSPRHGANVPLFDLGIPDSYSSEDMERNVTEWLQELEASSKLQGEAIDAAFLLICSVFVFCECCNHSLFQQRLVEETSFGKYQNQEA